MFSACSRCGRIHKFGTRCPTKALPRFVQDMPYERHARSTWSWTKKSKEVRSKAQYLCEVCRDQGIYTYDDVEVHHIEKVRDAPEMLLENENLVCLCQAHHKAADAGEISKEYLKRLARDRECK